MHDRAGCTTGAEEDTLEVVAIVRWMLQDVVASKEYDHSIYNLYTAIRSSHPSQHSSKVNTSSTRDS